MNGIVWTAFFFFSIGNAFGGEPLDGQRSADFHWEENGGSVQELMDEDRVETTESILIFLRAISGYAADLQQDLVEARLVGEKRIRIRAVLTERPNEDDRCTFQEGLATYRVRSTDEDFGRWAKAHERLNRLGICTGKGLNVDLRGTVVDLDVARDRGNVMIGIAVEMENVRFERIQTLYGEGSFAELLNSLEEQLDRQAHRLMNVGLESRPERNSPNRPPKIGTTGSFSNSLAMEFVRIPSGEFLMGGCGEPDEQPVRRVRISHPFFLGRHEVTQAQWRRIMGGNPSVFGGCDDCPVENVSWNDVQLFLRKMNRRGDGRYRLPTEAEWEYAARAGSSAPFSFGGDERRLDAHAWHSGNSGGRTHPVYRKALNFWGVFDMYGNVAEWCEDWYGEYVGFSPNHPFFANDPEGPQRGRERVVRGGSCASFARDCRSARRDGRAPEKRYHRVGFRLVFESNAN